MAKAVVTLFDSLDTAKAVRQRLVEGGFEDVRIRIVGPDDKLETEPVMSKDVADVGERSSEKEGAAGVISRMLSGGLISDRISEYARAVKGGKTMVALDVPDDATAERVAILKEVRAATRPPPATRAEGAGPEGNENPVDPTDTLTLPQVYSLPNAPTDWDEATPGEQSVIDTLSDPGRPAASRTPRDSVRTTPTTRSRRARRRRAAGAGRRSRRRRAVPGAASSYPEIPPRVEYHLTGFGQQFIGVLDTIERLERQLQEKDRA